MKKHYIKTWNISHKYQWLYIIDHLSMKRMCILCLCILIVRPKSRPKRSCGANFFMCMKSNDSERLCGNKINTYWPFINEACVYTLFVYTYSLNWRLFLVIIVGTEPSGKLGRTITARASLLVASISRTVASKQLPT